ncbi:MAG: NUDIX hydrolase [Lachnospiraceae bacterium]|nr:NUDIX hydrolase [Lachnospiraceae bacterium]
MFNIREIDYDQQEYARLAEKQAESEEIFDGVILHVFRDKVELPNGDLSVREVIAHVEAVCVVPVDADGNVILERQYRYPIDAVITEIPAGKLDKEGEDPLEGAKRELREETGITADRWTDLGLFVPAAAYCAETIRMYLAQDLHQGKQQLDEDEFLDVFRMPLKDAVQLVMDGKIPDAKTQAALLKAARLLHI